ncbi:MAG TPA: methyltransferase [Vicinamibacterales bacterium]|nr:methyltransferase [Vicinamibacterales bacterium]
MDGAETALRSLKRYLDALGYHGAYKYLVTANHYPVSGSAFNGAQRNALRRFDRQIHDDDRGIGLARCLTTRTPCSKNELTTVECDLAEELASAGLLSDQGEAFGPGDYQLVSAFDRYLLLDALINFDGGRMHDVYVGPDSYLVLYYSPVDQLRPEHRVLDLCTGTGIIALGLSRFAGQVVATDIGEAPLRLAQLNCALNDVEDKVTIRREDFHTTLASPETFDLIVCNPPYVASPPDLPTPLYAQGSDADGLGLLRALMERAPAKLTPDGNAVFVADLIGDFNRPYYFDDLERIAKEQSLRIDAYVDNRLKGEYQIPAFTFLFARTHPEIAPEDIEERIRHFIFDELRAYCYYLTTLRVRRQPGDPGLRVFDRHRVTSFDGFFPI